MHLSKSLLVSPFLAVMSWAAPAAQGSGPTFFVTTTQDTVDFAGAQTIADLPGPDGRVSMREATVAASNTPGPETIGFHIPVADWGASTGPRLRNGGPAFTLADDGTTIDGTTQTAFTGDTNPTGPEVDFLNVHPAYLGVANIYVTGDDCRIVGLGTMFNRGYGVYLAGDRNIVQGCKIGGPLYAGVRIEGNDNVVGGTQSGEGNDLSSGNDGVRIEHTATGNVVVGNFLHGSVHGIHIRGSATGNRVGGFAPGESNRIAEAGHPGEHGFPIGDLVSLESDGNALLGNLIGTDASGTSSAFNVADVGVDVTGSMNSIIGNVIGGITGTQGTQAGIALGAGANANIIQDNTIGVDRTGTIPIPNGVGVVLFVFATSLPSPEDNLIGGTAPGEGNVIAHNQEGGISVQWMARRNRISGNSIHSNSGGIGALGIDLGADGPTPNDSGDLDTGANDFMNYPSIQTATAGASGTTIVTGTLDTPNPEAATLEFFANPAPSFGAVVEGRDFLGSASAAPDGTFVVVLPFAVSGQAMTATATDASGNTSELSIPVLVDASPWTDLGHGLVGSFGVPALAGAGTLAPGSPVALDLTGALPGTVGVWVVGERRVDVPFRGGILVPSPEILILFVVDGTGSNVLNASWPTTATPGFQIFAQGWLFDPGGPQNAAASNAIVGTTP